MLLDNVDSSILALRTRIRPKSLSLFQMKELLGRFLNNSDLTENMKISLSRKLGVTQGQVKYFFQTQRKKPRNISIQAYSELLQGKRLKCTILKESGHACIYSVFIYMYQARTSYKMGGEESHSSSSPSLTSAILIHLY